MSKALTHVEIGISNPAGPDGKPRLEVLVDTGATLSVIPSDESLGYEVDPVTGRLTP